MSGYDIRHTELPTGLVRIGILSAESLRHAEVANAQRRCVAQHRDDFIRQGRGQVIKLRIMSGVLKWQDSHGSLPRETWRGWLLPFAEEKSEDNGSRYQHDRRSDRNGEPIAPVTNRIASRGFGRSGFDVALQADQIGFHFCGALAALVAIFGQGLV